VTAVEVGRTHSETLADVLDACVQRGMRASGLTVGFAGMVRSDQRALSISTLRGTRTNSLTNLQVSSGEGLGGKALVMRRPASVREYLTARGITRRYDRAVEAEGLKSMLSVPIGVNGREPLAVLYLADRRRLDLGDRASDLLRPVVGEVAVDLQVAVETHRRVEALRADLARAAVADLPDLRGDLQALIESTTDAGTKDGLRALLARVDGVRRGEPLPSVPSPLTARETDVLRHAERGSTNLEIASALGLGDSTVKSYMKTAMAKLGADNRVRACRVARERCFLA